MYKAMKSDVYMDAIEKLCDDVYNNPMKDVEDARQYVKDITALIYDYKMLGMIYDFYAEDAEVIKQNCEKLIGPDAFFKNVSPFLAAFPDLTADVENIIVNKENDESFKVFRRLRYKGTNTGISKYGKATGKSLENKCLNLTLMYIKKINGKWKITFAVDSDSEDCIRDAQIAD
ncbi:MAG: ester cyclase [Anaerovoracaceae bacterium]